MAKFEQKDNSGALFKNDYKTEGSKQPDYKGTCSVNGKDMEVSMWAKESKNGNFFFSLSFQEPYQKNAGAGKSGRDDDSDIPY